MELIIVPEVILVGELDKCVFKYIMNIIFILLSTLTVYQNISHIYCFIMGYKYK